jgi:ficolin
LLLQPQQLSTQVSAGGSIGANPSSTSAVATNKFPIDCQEAYEAETVNVDGHQRRVPEGFQYPTIEPRGSRDPFKACCKVLDNRTSWTVIQRRQDGSVDFYRNWSAYKAGFGHVEGEFWIGNERLHHLTSQGDYRLRVEMVTWDDQPHWAEYEYFRVSSEADKYRLHVTGFVAGGDAGDSLTSAWDNDHNGQPFSTYDSDNDARYYDNCAQHYRGAWWFHSCFQSHLNGVYYQRGTHSNFFVRNGIQWNTIHPHSSLRRVVMMVRRNDDVTAAGGGSTSSGDILSNGVE